MNLVPFAFEMVRPNAGDDFGPVGNSIRRLLEMFTPDCFKQSQAVFGFAPPDDLETRRVGIRVIPLTEIYIVQRTPKAVP